MPVLTPKEYEKRKRLPQEKKNATVEPVKETKSVEPTTEEVPVLFEYVLFYPDNVSDRYHNGSYRLVDTGGEGRTYIIRDGVIKVPSVEEKNLLVRKGFLFIEKREVSE